MTQNNDITDEQIVEIFRQAVYGQDRSGALLDSSFTAKGVRAVLDVALAAERAKCATAARNARLPTEYQWGDDAMQSFIFGKERAALAIEAAGDARKDNSDAKVPGEE